MNKEIKTLSLLRNELNYFYITLLRETYDLEPSIKIVENVWNIMYPNINLKKTYGISYKDIFNFL